jgi:flagellar M-ring protein FliF
VNEPVPVPAGGQAIASPPPSLLTPLTDPAGGDALARLRTFGGQPGVRRMLPWFVGLAALGGAALAWTELTPAPQRTLYTELADGERASVVGALDKANIAYRIDRDTGALSVSESDYYRARMLVASDNALATPESGDQLLNSLPIGASRTLEGERLREAREHDLMLTIMQIDGVEGARVHLAEPERSVFVREDTPPSASVMVRLARGRHLSDSQVRAIVNLVASSVPGLSTDAVRVVDQGGQLLTARNNADGDRLELQARMEDKLRGQVEQLLTPMLGQGNFSTEIQVDLDLDQVTAARENYDKQGAVRSENQQASQAAVPQPALGVPGTLSNSPPPPATPKAGPPTPTTPTSGAPTPMSSDSSSSRTYELGREVQVSQAAPGKVKRLTVAVAVSNAAKGSKPADVAELQQLVSAAVGADPGRGDQVAVVVRSFQPDVPEKTPFYEAAWFAPLLRALTVLGAVLLVLLLAVRPLLKLLRPPAPPEPEDAADAAAREAEEVAALIAAPAIDPETGRADRETLTRKVGIAQRLAADQPDRAASALRQMLAQPAPEPAMQ